MDPLAQGTVSLRCQLEVSNEDPRLVVGHVGDVVAGDMQLVAKSVGDLQSIGAVAHLGCSDNNGVGQQVVRRTANVLGSIDDNALEG
jgi:hypothetical protein